MNKKYITLGAALIISSTIVSGTGAYLKYGVFRPLNVAQDESIVALPFRLMSDPVLRRQVKRAMEANEALKNPPVTDPATQPTTESTYATTVATDPSESVSKDPVDETDPVTTEPPVSESPEIQPTDPPPLPTAWYPPMPTEATEPTDSPSGEESTLPGDETDPQPIVPEDPTEPARVDESWYDDVLFIGDSRTRGLQLYSRSGNADYFCAVGMNVYNVQSKTSSDNRFTDINLGTLLSIKPYGKIIICLGLNESGTPMEDLIEAYADLVAMIRRVQPEAKIILQGILTMGKNQAEKQSYFSPRNLANINARVAAMADGVNIFYIDPNPTFADEEGYLPPEITGDGCHLYAEDCAVFAEWISTEVAKLGI